MNEEDIHIHIPTSIQIKFERCKDGTYKPIYHKIEKE